MRRRVVSIEIRPHSDANKTRNGKVARGGRKKSCPLAPPTYAYPTHSDSERAHHLRRLGAFSMFPSRNRLGDLVEIQLMEESSGAQHEWVEALNALKWTGSSDFRVRA